MPSTTLVKFARSVVGHRMRADPTAPFAIKPGEWVRLTTDDPGPFICCPGCKLPAGISSHKIAQNGLVTPSVVCDRPHCDFHEFIQLVGWGSD